MRVNEKLLKLYEDNIDTIYLKAELEKEILPDIVEALEEILEILPKGQKQLLENLQELDNTKNEKIAQTAFCYGYKLAIIKILENIVDIA